MEGAEFKPAGYKILLEMLVMGKFQNVVEVPFIFEDRSSGASKMKIRQQFDYLKAYLQPHAPQRRIGAFAEIHRRRIERSDSQ